MSTQKDNPSSPDGERIAKVLARAGIASRRDAEKLIEAGRVKVNGKTLTTPAFKVTARDKIEFDGRRVAAKEPTRLWQRYLILNPYYLSLVFLQITGLKKFDPATTDSPKQEILYG